MGCGRGVCGGGERRPWVGRCVCVCVERGGGGRQGLCASAHRKSSSAASMDAWFSPLSVTPGSELSASRMVVEPLRPVPRTKTCRPSHRSHRTPGRRAHAAQSHHVGSQPPSASAGSHTSKTKVSRRMAKPGVAVKGARLKLVVAVFYNTARQPGKNPTKQAKSCMHAAQWRLRRQRRNPPRYNRPCPRCTTTCTRQRRVARLCVPS